MKASVFIHAFSFSVSTFGYWNSEWGYFLFCLMRVLKNHGN